MITVYCQKLSSSWLAPEMYGLTGVVLGATISGLLAWLIQRANAKRTIELENRKNKVKVFTDFFAKDIVSFIDSEVEYLQKLFVDFDKEKTKGIPEHHKNMTCVDTTLRMFNDIQLNDLFKTFVHQESLLRQSIVENKNDIALDVVVFAREIAARLKWGVIDKCDFKL